MDEIGLIETVLVLAEAQAGPLRGDAPLRPVQK